MKFGYGPSLYLPHAASPSYFDDIIGQISLLEKYGFDYVTVGERHLYADGFLEPLTTMSTVLGRTERIKVMASILLLPTYDPLRLAEMISTMDWISRGRTILGVGIGYRPEELRAFGATLKDRVPRFNEALTVIHRLWTEPRVTFTGKFYNYEDVFVSPKPFQKPHPPIVVGGAHPNVVRRAARLGDAWTASSVENVPQLKELIAIYRSSLRKYGKRVTQGEVYIGRDGYIAKDYDTAKRVVAPPLMKLYENYRKWSNPHITSLPKADLDDLRKDLFLIGNPDDFIREIERLEKIGVNAICFRFDYSGIPQERIHDAIKLLGEKVLPHFRDE